MFNSGPLQGCFFVQDHDWSLLKIQPMVVPPLPWRSIDSGGLLFTPQKVMRTRTEAQLQALQEAEAALPNGMRKVLAWFSLCCNTYRSRRKYHNKRDLSCSGRLISAVRL